MSLQTQIDQDLTAAMKAEASERVAVLRLVKNSLQNEQIKLGHELSEAEALKVLQREAKQRKESIAQYQQGGRDDLVAAEQQELDLIAAYLPQPMSQEELDQLVAGAIEQVRPAGPADMGKVIGAVMQSAAGRADGAAVAQAVRRQLA